MKKIFTVLAVASSLLVGGRLYAQDVNLYVAVGGAGNAPCTAPGNPCGSITEALAAAPTVTAPDRVIINVNIGEYVNGPETFPLQITKSNITLRGGNQSAAWASLATLPGRNGRTNAGNEAVLNFATATEHILVKNGVNNFTVEGFQFIESAFVVSASESFIRFDPNGVNTNITVRRCVFDLSSAPTRSVVYRADDAGSLTNLRIQGNRMSGYDDNTIPVIQLDRLASGRIDSNFVGLATAPIAGTAFVLGSSVGTLGSNGDSLVLSRNVFQFIINDAIRVNDNVSGSSLIIRNNAFDRVGQNGPSAGTTPPTNAGILVNSNSLQSNSLLDIRNNDFINFLSPTAPSRVWIGFTGTIPATSTVNVVRNRFSFDSNTQGPRLADVYFANAVPPNRVNLNANWWGQSPYTDPVLASGFSGTSTNIWVGGTGVDGTGTVLNQSLYRPAVWLTANTESPSTNITAVTGTNPSDYSFAGFIPTRRVTFPGPVFFQPALDAMKNSGLQTWELEVPNGVYNPTDESLTTYTAKNTFTLDPVTATTTALNTGVRILGLTVDAVTVADPDTITLNKNLGIGSDVSAGTLTFTQGFLKLNTSDLIVNGNVTGGNSISYAITNNSGGTTGLLIRTVGTSTLR